MYWKNDPNGSGYRIRQFDTPASNPMRNSMRNLAAEELTVPPKRRRRTRSLRLMLPAWLSVRAVQDYKKMKNETNQERNDNNE